MKAMTLNEIAAAADGALNCGAEISIKDICIDTRKVKPGSLYIAIKGERFDGHDFIPKAFELGAAAVVSSKPIETGRPVVAVADTRLALGRIAAYYRSLFSIPVIGITGSVGKTSTKEMIAAVLGTKYRVHKTQGNLNNDIGLPMTLFGLDETHTAAVIEMGMSALGEISYLSKITQPNLAVITNVGVSHMETLGSRENILKAKLEILDGLKPDGRVLLNADNDMLAGVRETLSGRAEYFGIDSRDSIVFADNIRQVGDTMEFSFVHDGKTYPAVLPLIGIHNVYNALAAFAVGMHTGVTPEQIVNGVREFENAGMRQRLTEYNNIKVIEDCYNASPDSMEAAIRVIHDVECTGSRIAVFGDMLELGRDSEQLHRQVGAAAAEAGIDFLLCCGEQAVWIAEGAKQNGMLNVIHCREKEQAVKALKEILKQGDAVIVKASRGMRMEEIIQQVFNR